MLGSLQQPRTTGNIKKKIDGSLPGALSILSHRRSVGQPVATALNYLEKCRSRYVWKQMRHSSV